MKQFIFVLALFIIILPIGQANAEVDSGSRFVSVSKSATYTVAVGDTLWAIANDIDVSIEDLISWNNLDSTIIYPGQQLKLVIEPEIARDDKSDTYTVKRGDTLIEIARSHDISLEELIHSNAITSYLIYPGNELIVGGDTVTKPFSTVAAITTINDEGIRIPVYNPPIAQDSTSVQEIPKAIATTPSIAVNEPAPTKSENTVSTNAPSTSSGKEMTMTATAYTAYCTGCSGTTYTGIDLRANPNQKVIAVDPNVIPLGSRVWVEGYGEAIAGDIGGAIKGNIIDVFIEHKKDAMNWGRKTVKIKVLD